jgi:aspartate/tyrosine/aromatic aminotransferase
MDKEYLPIDGLASFNDLTRNLIFGKDTPAVKE